MTACRVEGELFQSGRTRIHKLSHMHLCSSIVLDDSAVDVLPKAMGVAVASKTLKLTHLAIGGYDLHGWFPLRAEGAQAWVHAMAEGGTGPGVLALFGGRIFPTCYFICLFE